MTDERDLIRKVADAIRGVRDPGTGKDVVSAGLLKGLKAEDGGRVSIRLAPPPEGGPGLIQAVREAAESVDGVDSAQVSTARAEGDRRAGGRKLPVLGQGAPAANRPGAAPGPGPAPRPTPPQPQRLPGVSHVIAVSSGKGGVGKSTVATNLAAAMSVAGHRVGLMDADVYGPNIPMMFGAVGKPGVTRDERIVPLEAHGVKLMSIGFLIEGDTPAIWRGPIVMGIIRQFLQQVLWGELDYLIVDMPPGTGDAQLSLVQLVALDGAVMVTTPQGVATADVLKGIKMFERVDVPVLGLVENMSGFVCPHCGERTELFGREGGRKLAATTGVELLGEIPLGASVVQASDTGRPTVLSAPDSPEGVAFREVAQRVMAAVGARAGKAGTRSIS